MIKQTIGFDRELDLSWLDLTAGLTTEEADIETVRQKLRDKLAPEIPGAEACRKTVTLLTRLWVRVPSEHQQLQAEALDLLPRVLPSERLWLHWGMSLLAYPFFRDVATVTGQLLKLQGEFEPLQVRRRMREGWGQRTTLDRAINRLIQTLELWGVIEEIKPTTRIYHSSPAQQTEDRSLALWLMSCVFYSIKDTLDYNSPSLPLSEVIQTFAIFPFDLTSHILTLRQSDRFKVSRQGVDLEMVSVVSI